jgi:hypothetical protein
MYGRKTLLGDILTRKETFAGIGYFKTGRLHATPLP